MTCKICKRDVHVGWGEICESCYRNNPQLGKQISKPRQAGKLEQFIWGAVIVIPILTAIVAAEKPEETEAKQNITKQRAEELCFRAWQSNDDIMAMQPRYENRWAIKGADDIWQAGVNYKINGDKTGYWCEVFLKNGKIRYRVTRLGLFD